MNRRTFLASSAAALAAPGLATGQGRAGTLKMVPQANLTSLDPIWTTANITRNHGFMIYDTLYGLDSGLEPQPQMAAGHTVEENGRSITITLREDLRFHDGEPVRAADAVASLTRWSRRNPYGQKVASLTDELAALDDRRLRYRLKKPFPLLFHALGSIGNAAFVMPERIARTDAFKQVDDPTGSGPFRFKRDEFNSGSRVVYERNTAYVPRPDGKVSLTAGPKRVFFDRVEWHIITDPATAAAALQAGEIDWYEQPPPELQQLMRRNRAIQLSNMDPSGMPAVMRLNFLHPPFNDRRVRQALLPAIVQEDFMQAVVGTDPDLYRTGVGVFLPGTPLASEAGLEALTGPRSLERAKGLLKEAGYTDQPLRLIGPTDILAPAALSQVSADLFRRLGMNLDFALTDWGTVVQRRASREPLDKGGWSALCTSFSSFDFADPAVHPLLRGNGPNAWFGWPAVPRLEELRDAWFEAPDAAARRALGAEMQRVALEEVAFVPLGAYYSVTATRELADRVPGFALFWNLRRA